MKIADKPEAPFASSDKLTKAEVQHLADLEQTIEKGLKTFMEVGEALLEIRDQRLYRKHYKSFDEYCHLKWKFTARQANRLIGAGEVVENLKRDQLVSLGPIAIPENEAQARPLTELTPSKQIEAARIAATKAHKPTAKEFKEAAQEVKEKPHVAKPENSKNVIGKAKMESLIEIIDQLQTMVKEDKPKTDIMKKLKTAADLATRINNGGAI